MHQLVAINIPIGDHVKEKIAGFTLNMDTIWSTVFAGAVVCLIGFYMRARITSGKPNKVQLFWETLVGIVGDNVEKSLGARYRHVVPLCITIFTLVLACNWLSIFPFIYHNTDYLPPPAADVNLTYALGVLVFILTNAAGIRAKGVGGYFKGFFVKPLAMAPIRILEELMKPVTLALRLFGNIFSGTIMVALLLALNSSIYFAPASIFFSVLWKLFDMAIGVIQAFIFALLTMLYYQFAVSEEAH